MPHISAKPGLVRGTGLGGLQAQQIQKSDARVRLRVIDTHASIAYAWQDHGACRDADAGLFFTVEGEIPRDKKLREEAARAFCEACPVRTACLEHALSAPERFGIWAGLDEQELEAERANRKQAARTAA